jgi:hypothetical protein
MIMQCVHKLHGVVHAVCVNHSLAIAVTICCFKYRLIALHCCYTALHALHIHRNIRYQIPITLKDLVLTKKLVGDGEAALLYEGGHLNVGMYACQTHMLRDCLCKHMYLLLCCNATDSITLAYPVCVCIIIVISILTGPNRHSNQLYGKLYVMLLSMCTMFTVCSTHQH